jgi:hypothetical protein
MHVDQIPNVEDSMWSYSLNFTLSIHACADQTINTNPPDAYKVSKNVGAANVFLSKASILQQYYEVVVADIC